MKWLFYPPWVARLLLLWPVVLIVQAMDRYQRKRADSMVRE